MTPLPLPLSQPSREAAKRKHDIEKITSETISPLTKKKRVGKARSNIAISPKPNHSLLPEIISNVVTNIVTPREQDVICGRGNFANYHSGNAHFRNLVQSYKIDYVACDKSDKKKFSKMIYETIRNLKPPGRFLKFDPRLSSWYDIGEKKALDKTRQALREGAPEIMKELLPDQEAAEMILDLKKEIILFPHIEEPKLSDQIPKPIDDEEITKITSAPSPITVLAREVTPVLEKMPTTRKLRLF